MKKVFQLLLLVVIVGLGYLLFREFATPMEFQNIQKQRDTEVVNRLKDIRQAQRAYRQVYQKFTPSMDTLINFVMSDSMIYERAVGSADDSLAVAQGRVRREQFKMPVRDTVFSGRNLTNAQIEDFRNIPYGNGQKIIMDAGTLETGSGVVIQVFEAKAPYKAYLTVEGYEQELVNLIDQRKALNKYPGMRVGSMTEATNEAGNWEQL